MPAAKRDNPIKVCRDVNALLPAFRLALVLALEQANRETVGKFTNFYAWVIFETYRSQTRQDYLYAQGRTRPGSIVTHTKHSRHTERDAADIVWLDRKGRFHWDGPLVLWQILGHAARTYGLEWGGDWSSFVDLPHIQAKAREVP